MATKIRKKTIEEKYEVCDLCGDEIDICNGNKIEIPLDGDGLDGKTETVYIHLTNNDGCGIKLLAGAVRASRKKK